MTQAAPAKRRWGWPVRLLVLLAVLVGLVIVILATGVLQHGLVQAGVQVFFQGRVEVGSVSTLGGLGISRLAIYDADNAQGPPVLLLEGFKLDYRLFSGNARHIGAITLDRLDVDIKQAQRAVKTSRQKPKPEASDIKPVRQPQPTNAGLSFLPESIEIKSLNIRSTAPSYGYDAQGLSVHAALSSPESLTAAVEGQNVSMKLWTRAGFSREITGGHVNFAVSKNGTAVTVNPLEANMPGLLAIAGSMAFDGPQMDVDLRQCVAEGVDFTQADPWDMSMPFGFKRIDLSGSSIKGRMVYTAFAISVPETVMRLVAEDLTVGPRGAEYYKGNLAVELLGAAGSEGNYTLTATLNRNQKITAALKGHHMAATGHASLEGWSREDLLAALPVKVQGSISNLPLLSSINKANVDFDWKSPVITMSGAASAAFNVKGETRLGQATFSVEGPVMPLLQRDVKVKSNLQLAGGTVSTETTFSAVPSKAMLLLENIDPNLWLTTLNDRDLLQKLSAKVSGAVTLEPGDTADQLRASLDLKSAPFACGGFVVPENETFSILGNLTFDLGELAQVSGPLISGAQLDLRVNDDNYVTLRDWKMPIVTFALEGKAESKLDLSLLESMMPGSDLRGQLAFSGPFHNDRGFTDLDFTGTIEGLGYKNFAGPYGVPIDAAGTLSYDNLNGRLTGRTFAFKLPEATTLESDGWTYGSGQFSAPFTLKTDFKPLVPMGLLDKVEGGAGTFAGAFSYGEAGPRLEATLDTHADALTLPGASAALTGAAVSAKVFSEADGVIRGEGTAAADKMALLGTVFEQIKGPLSLEGDVLKAQDLHGTTFGGTVDVDLEAALLTENLPVLVQLKASKVDLELFSRTLEVPTVQMTGLADGEAKLAMHYPGGIQDFKADLSCADHFSVSTALLERLLALQFASQYAGKQQMERVRAKILGKEDLRPFDSGRLVLNYEGERIGGQAILKSKGLDLTVDLQMDTEAFFSALKIAQEAHVESLGSLE